MRRGGTGRGMGRGTRGGVGGGAGCGDAAVIPSLLVDNQLMLLVETRNSTTNSVLLTAYAYTLLLIYGTCTLLSAK